MLRVRERLGNLSADRATNRATNPDLAAQIQTWQDTGQLEEITLDERDAHKSRLRVQTLSGRELGLILPRGTTLTDGDVFSLAAEDGGVLVHISLQEIMVLTPLAPTQSTDPHHLLQHAVRLGHVLGNQHWPVAVVGEQILVPVSLDRAVMETVLRTHHMTDYFQIQYERRAWPHDQKEHEDQKDKHNHATHPGHTH